MSILGLDYGDRKIGVAKSAGNIAVPLMILENRGAIFVLQELKEICQDNGITKIVVGIPLSLGGKRIRKKDKENSHTKKFLDFIEILRNSLTVKVVTEDERLSTKLARKLGKGSMKGKDDDAVSAMLILQSYLDKVLHHD